RMRRLNNTPTFLLDESELTCVGGYLRPRGDPELLDRARPVGLHRALGYMQLLGDLGVGEAQRDQAHNLALTLGKRDPLLVLALAGNHQRAKARGQVIASRHRQAESLQQLGRLVLLEHIAARAGTQSLARVLGVLAHREDRHRERRVRHEAGRQRREAGTAGHREVECEQVGLELSHGANRRGHVSRLRDNPELAGLALEHRANTVAHDSVIVGDYHVYWPVHAGSFSRHTGLTVQAPLAASRSVSSASRLKRAPAYLAIAGRLPLWDDARRHLWDDNIGTTRSTDKRPSGHHHCTSDATASSTCRFQRPFLPRW